MVLDCASVSMESPLLSFEANAETGASSSGLFLGLEWPSLMPPFSFSNQQEQQQIHDGMTIENSGIMTDDGFGLIEQTNVDDVMIDADLLTLRPPRCTNNIVDG